MSQLPKVQDMADAKAVVQYLQLCEPWQKKRSLLNIYYSNSICQIDFVDMQSNPVIYFKFIKFYQNHLTKFAVLRPLIFKQTEVLRPK